ncbi:hypothetical protein IWW52_003292, partial [Coemansia sp. RSA 2704]
AAQLDRRSLGQAHGRGCMSADDNKEMETGHTARAKKREISERHARTTAHCADVVGRQTQVEQVQKDKVAHAAVSAMAICTRWLQSPSLTACALTACTLDAAPS